MLADFKSPLGDLGVNQIAENNLLISGYHQTNKDL